MVSVLPKPTRQISPALSDEQAIVALKNLPLLQKIDQSLWDTLTPLITFRRLAESETLFKAREESQNLYLVVSGKLALYMPHKNKADTYYLQARYQGDTAGDFAALNGGEHLVNAVAVEPCLVAQFPRFALDKLANIDSELLAYVYDVAAELSKRTTLASAYLNLFGDISQGTMSTLLEKTSIHYFRSGETLFREGDPSDALFFVVFGKLIIETSNSAGQTRRIAEVQAPETVGELAMLADSNRSATVIAARESTVARLGRKDFNELIAPDASMLMPLARLVVRRHVANARSESTAQADRNFVLIPLDSHLPLRRFVTQLKRAMRELGTVLTLYSRSFDTLYGRSGASMTSIDDIFSAAITQWLDDKEKRFESMIYIADRQWNAWTKRCVNRGDRIIFLASARADNDAQLRSIETELKTLFDDNRVRPSTDLVLLHDKDTIAPRRTARWLRPRELDAYYHVRLNDKLHYARLARRLRNRATGIVFSGGGARGYAHVGVQQIIEENRIPIDYIGGSSMGALLGASMAMGNTTQDIKAMSAMFANKKALYDYTLPLVSLMKSSKLSGFCKTVYGAQRIEDLWVPFFCLSSNLADGREVLHDRGPLWKVIRSTISLPGVFSPVPTGNGDLLTDGAVLNTFPVSIMKRRLGGKGFIIGVNVSQISEQFHNYTFDTSLSGWRVFLSRINPFQASMEIPRIAETLLRSTDIKSIERLNEARASLDVLVEPNVAAISLLDFKSYELISQIGYREGLKVFSRHGLIDIKQHSEQLEHPDTSECSVQPGIAQST